MTNMELTPHILSRVSQELTLANSVPVMTRAAFALAVGLPLGVLVAQCEKGYWPVLHVGKRVFVNLEAVRVAAAQKGKEFSL
jgi:hypothetical protein